MDSVGRSGRLATSWVPRGRMLRPAGHVRSTSFDSGVALLRYEPLDG